VESYGYDKRQVDPPSVVAGQYRSLRKAFEDRKNEPGAADFYYGEMEMRRHAASAWSVERLILTGYWALSGYGLRAGRSLLALVGLLSAGAGALWWWGLTDPHPSFSTAVLASIESASSLLRSGPSDVTAWGQVIELALRILGPALLALAALALRGRVKR
jgi:hypothetical protein